MGKAGGSWDAVLCMRGACARTRVEVCTHTPALSREDGAREQGWETAAHTGSLKALERSRGETVVA